MAGPRESPLPNPVGTLSSSDLDAAGLAVGCARVDLLARLGDGLENGIVVERGLRNDLYGSLFGGLAESAAKSYLVGLDAVKLLEDAIDGAGAATAGHGDGEVVGVVRHVWESVRVRVCVL